MVDGIPIFQKVRRKGSRDKESGVLAGRRIEGRNSNGGAKPSSAVRETLDWFDLREPLTISSLLALETVRGPRHGRQALRVDFFFAMEAHAIRLFVYPPER